MKRITQPLSLFFLLIMVLSVFYSVNANPVFISVSANSGFIGKYQKFELIVNFTASYSNPYDFSQVNLKCKFTSPTGIVYNVDGFYYQPYNMPQPDNLVLVGNPDWRVRFAPNETGAWSYLLTCTDVNGTTSYPVGQFECTQSALRGFVHPAANNQFKYDDGGKFLGIGTNLGWTEWSEGFTIYQDWINELGANGGNFTKIVMAPWSFELEWQETGTGNYSLRQNRAWALDWIFDHLTEYEIYCQLNIMIHDELRSSNTPGWLQNPYNTANGGPCNEPQNFLVNTTAKGLFQRKIRYIMARWGYSSFVSSWEILSEADNTGVYNDFRTQTLSWLNEMTSYTKSLDIRNRPVSSGFAIPEHDQDYWNNASTMFTQLHIYGMINDLELKIYNYSKDYLTKYNKPAIVGEFALAYTPEEVFQNDPGGITFHNTLWSSALSGTVSTAMSWWWNTYLYPNGFFSYFGPLSSFLGQVNFPSQNAIYEIPLCTSDINLTLDISPGFVSTLQRAPANDFAIEPNGSLIPNNLNLGKYLYGYFFNSDRNPPTFHVNYTKPGEFTVFTGGSVSLSKIKIWLDGVTLVSNNASSNSYYTIAVPVGQHTIFVENVGNGIMEISKYRLLNYSPVLRGFVARNSDHAIGWIQNRKYNWEYVKQNGIPPAVTGGIINLNNYNPGLYKIDWFNANGTFDSTTTALSVSGNLVLNSPEITWDGAFELNYYSPLSIAFTANPTTGDAPLSVQFTDGSFNAGVLIDSYFWDFGDGSTSTLRNPAHIYNLPGSYDVFFKIKSGIYADSILKTDLINVTQPLVAEFAADHTRLLRNYPVHFGDLSLGSPTSWHWNFGDNQTSTYQNPTHNYTQVGFYDVTLTIQKGTKSDTETKQDYIEVYNPLVANFSTNKTQALPNDPIQFTDLSAGSPDTWKWDFGNGLFSTVQNPVFFYSVPGVYSVELMVKANWRADSLTKTSYITILPPLVSNFVADTTFTLINEAIQFTDLSSGGPNTWKWDFGNGQFSAIQNPIFVYSVPGIYSVELLVKSGWRADSLTKTNYITIVEPLTAAFVADTTLALTGESIHFTDLSQGNPDSWFWDFGNGESSTLQNPEIQYNSPGFYTIKLIVANDWFTDTLIIENYITVIEPLITNFMASKTLAFTENAIQFTDLSQGNPEIWHWDFGNGQVSSLQNPVYTYTFPGVYSISLVVANNWLTDSMVKENYITVVQTLVSNFKADTTFAWLGHTTQFTDLSIGNPTIWWWNFGDQKTSQVQNPAHVYTLEGTYTVVLAVANQYQSDYEFKLSYITIREPLKAQFKADTTKVLTGQDIRFTNLSTGFPTSRIWDFGDNTVSQVLNPVYHYLQPGHYTVSLQVFQNDSTDSEVKENFIWVRDTLIADFYAEPNVIHAGETVNFHDNSRGSPNQWKWFMGEGKSSNLQNPVYKYNTPGIFTVRLMVFDPFNSDTLIREDYITVLQPIYSQIVSLSQGWSGISTYLLPMNPALPDVFQSVAGNLVFAMNNAGIYWPSQNINTVGNWNPLDGLIIKMTDESQIEVKGDINPVNKIILSEGWNILPVISPCSQNSSTIFGPLGDTLVIVKEIAGVNVFWPEAGISTLEYVNSGKSYYILVTHEVWIQFQACSQKFLPIINNQDDSFFNPWNGFRKTSLSHTIAISKNAFINFTLNNSRIEDGDLIGVFNGEGLCSGIINIKKPDIGGKLEKPLALTAFGKDQMNTENTGLESGGQMNFRLFRQRTGEIFEVSASFDDKFPEKDFFGVNGLSGISSFTIRNATSLEGGIYIYPNPGEGLFRIEIREMTSLLHLEVLSAEGRHICEQQIDPSKINTLDLLKFEKGIYLLRFSDENVRLTKKLVLR